MTSIPSPNFTPWISFGNWLWPSIRRQLFWGPSTSLKTMASAVLFDRQPFDRMVYFARRKLMISLAAVPVKPRIAPAGTVVGNLTL